MRVETPPDGVNWSRGLGKPERCAGARDLAAARLREPGLAPGDPAAQLSGESGALGPAISLRHRRAEPLRVQLSASHPRSASRLRRRFRSRRARADSWEQLPRRCRTTRPSPALAIVARHDDARASMLVTPRRAGRDATPAVGGGAQADSDEAQDGAWSTAHYERMRSRCHVPPADRLTPW